MELKTNARAICRLFEQFFFWKCIYCKWTTRHIKKPITSHNVLRFCFHCVFWFQLIERWSFWILKKFWFNFKQHRSIAVPRTSILQCHSLHKLCSLNSGPSWMNERYFHDMDGELYTNLTWEKGFSAHSIARILKTIEHSCDFRSLSLNSNHWLLSASESCDTRLQN